MGDRVGNLKLESGKFIKDLTVIELKVALEERGLSKIGNKTELVHRLSIFEETAQKSLSSLPALEAPNQWLQEESDLNNDFLREYFQSQKALFRENFARKSLLGKGDFTCSISTSNSTKKSTDSHGISSTSNTLSKPPLCTDEKPKSSRGRGRPKKDPKKKEKQDQLPSNVISDTASQVVSLRSKSSICKTPSNPNLTDDKTLNNAGRSLRSSRSSVSRPHDVVSAPTSSSSESKASNNNLKCTQESSQPPPHTPPLVQKILKLPSLKIKLPETVPKLYIPLTPKKSSDHNVVKRLQGDESPKKKTICMSPQNAEVSSSVQDVSLVAPSKDNSSSTAEIICTSKSEGRGSIQVSKSNANIAPNLVATSLTQSSSSNIQRPSKSAKSEQNFCRTDTSKSQSNVFTNVSLKDMESIADRDVVTRKVKKKSGKKRSKKIIAKLSNKISNIISIGTKTKTDVGGAHFKSSLLVKEQFVRPSKTDIYKVKDSSIRRSTRLVKTDCKSKLPDNNKSSDQQDLSQPRSRSPISSLVHNEFLASLKQQIEMPLHVDKFPVGEKVEVSSTTELSDCSKPPSEFGLIQNRLSYISKTTPILDAHIAVEGHLDGNVTPDSNNSERYQQSPRKLSENQNTETKRHLISPTTIEPSSKSFQSYSNTLKEISSDNLEPARPSDVHPVCDQDSKLAKPSDNSLLAMPDCSTLSGEDVVTSTAVASESLKSVDILKEAAMAANIVEDISTTYETERNNESEGDSNDQSLVNVNEVTSKILENTSKSEMSEPQLSKLDKTKNPFHIKDVSVSLQRISTEDINKPSPSDNFSGNVAEKLLSIKPQEKTLECSPLLKSEALCSKSQNVQNIDHSSGSSTVIPEHKDNIQETNKISASNKTVIEPNMNSIDIKNKSKVGINKGVRSQSPGKNDEMILQRSEKFKIQSKILSENNELATKLKPITNKETSLACEAVDHNNRDVTLNEKNAKNDLSDANSSHNESIDVTKANETTQNVNKKYSGSSSSNDRDITLKKKNTKNDLSDANSSHSQSIDVTKANETTLDVNKEYSDSSSSNKMGKQKHPVDDSRPTLKTLESLNFESKKASVEAELDESRSFEGYAESGRNNKEKCTEETLESKSNDPIRKSEKIDSDVGVERSYASKTSAKSVSLVTSPSSVTGKVDNTGKQVEHSVSLAKIPEKSKASREISIEKSNITECPDSKSSFNQIDTQINKKPAENTLIKISPDVTDRSGKGASDFNAFDVGEIPLPPKTSSEVDDKKSVINVSHTISDKNVPEFDIKDLVSETPSSPRIGKSPKLQFKITKLKSTYLRHGINAGLDKETSSNERSQSSNLSTLSVDDTLSKTSSIVFDSPRLEASPGASLTCLTSEKLSSESQSSRTMKEKDNIQTPARPSLDVKNDGSFDLHSCGSFISKSIDHDSGDEMARGRPSRSSSSKKDENKKSEVISAGKDDAKTEVKNDEETKLSTRRRSRRFEAAETVNDNKDSLKQCEARVEGDKIETNGESMDHAPPSSTDEESQNGASKPLPTRDPAETSRAVSEDRQNVEASDVDGPRREDEENGVNGRLMPRVDDQNKSRSVSPGNRDSARNRSADGDDSRYDSDERSKTPVPGEQDEPTKDGLSHVPDSQEQESDKTRDNAEVKSPFKSARKVSVNRSRSSTEEEKPKKKKWGPTSGESLSSAPDISSGTLKTLVPDVAPPSPGELTLQLESGREMEEFQQELDLDAEWEENERKEAARSRSGERSREPRAKTDKKKRPDKDKDKAADKESSKAEDRESGDAEASRRSRKKRRDSASSPDRRQRRSSPTTTSRRRSPTGADRDKSGSRKDPARARRRSISRHKRSASPNFDRSGRKVRAVEAPSRATERVLVPPNPPSSVLMIRNLVRPFTIKQLQALIQRTAKIQPDGFWIDHIKSKCIVKVANEDEALETRMALNGVKWPSSNPKNLYVDYCKEDDLQKRLSESMNQRAEAVAEVKRTERRKLAGPVREWDLEKLGERSPGERERERERRRREREEARFEEVFEGPEEPPRRPARNEEKLSRPSSPIKTLDDLFNKTKAQPSVYWLPLTPEQIIEKEKERRKRMVENERRVAELEAEREKRLKEREEEREKERRRREERDKERSRRLASRRSRSRSRRRSRSRSKHSPRRSPRSQRSTSRDDRRDRERRSRRMGSKSKSRSASRSRSRSRGRS